MIGHDTTQHTVHATALALAGAGVLLRGPSGAGKSDLALRCLALGELPFARAGFHLVADDRVIVRACDGRLDLSAPEPIHGRIEVRGIGIVALADHLVVARGTLVSLALVIDLVTTRPERLPPEPTELVQIAGLGVPRLTLEPFEASAPLKVALALAQCG